MRSGSLVSAQHVSLLYISEDILDLTSIVKPVHTHKYKIKSVHTCDNLQIQCEKSVHFIEITFDFLGFFEMSIVCIMEV